MLISRISKGKNDWIWYMEIWEGVNEWKSDENAIVEKLKTTNGWREWEHAFQHA